MVFAELQSFCCLASASYVFLCQTLRLFEVLMKQYLNKAVALSILVSLTGPVAFADGVLPVKLKQANPVSSTAGALQIPVATGHPAEAAKSAVPVASQSAPQQQAIEIVMPDGSKRVGLIVGGTFIPLDGGKVVPPPSVQGQDDTLWRKTTYEKKVFSMGRHILEKNNIQERITFSVNHNKNVVNASGDSTYNNVIIEEGLFSYIESDDELAAVLSHEISHILLRHRGYNLPSGKKGMTSHAGEAMTALAAAGPAAFIGYGIGILIKNRIASSQEVLSQNHETDADLKGLELMNQAGYSLQGMRTIMEKIAADGAKNIWRSHPMGTERIAAIDKKINELENPHQFAPPQAPVLAGGKPVETEMDKTKTVQVNSSATPSLNLGVKAATPAP
jgi:hypothetical protein